MIPGFEFICFITIFLDMKLFRDCLPKFEGFLFLSSITKALRVSLLTDALGFVGEGILNPLRLRNLIKSS